MESTSLGLGLISIGRQWGFLPAPLPSDAEVDDLLETAVDGGIRLFDTAPSYGASESRLGAWLGRLTPERRGTLFIATKCGEHWNAGTNAPFTDHSPDALRRSIDRSLALLGSIGLLQIHKASASVVRDEGVRRALEYARGCGVREFGASITDLETAALVAADPLYSVIQFFYNRANRKLEEVFEIAARAGKRLIVNRPFGMGELLYDEAGALRGEPAMVDAFRFVLARRFRGAVLTGTRSAAHLRANLSSFEQACRAF